MKHLMMIFFVMILNSSSAKAYPRIAHVDLEMTFPAQFIAHMEAIQRGLTAKALEVCGGREKLVGLESISIQILPTLERSVGEVRGDIIQLIYPTLSATALAQCKD